MPEFEKDLKDLKNLENFSSKDTKDMLFNDIKKLFNSTYHALCGPATLSNPIFNQNSPQIQEKKSKKNLDYLLKQKSSKKILYHLENKNRSADNLKLGLRGSSVTKDD